LLLTKRDKTKFKDLQELKTLCLSWQPCAAES